MEDTDTSGAAKAVGRLNGDNWAIWSIRMREYLILKNCWQAVTGTNTTYDAKALALIRLSVSDQYLSVLRGATNALEAWTLLTSIFESNTGSRKIQLRRELSSLAMQPGESLQRYLVRASDLKAQCVTAGLTMDESDFVLSLLAGLSEEYDTVVTVLEQSVGPLTYVDVEARLRMVEHRHRLKNECAPGTEQALAVNASRPQYSNVHTRGANAPNQKKIVKCWGCGKLGHAYRECRSKHLWDEATKRRLESHPRNVGAKSSTSPPAKAYVCEEQEEDDGAIALSVLAASTGGGARWILDSGASRHIATMTTNMTNVRRLKKECKVLFANGTHATAKSIGDVELRGIGALKSFIAKDVLLVPGATVNLFSVPMATSKGATFQFTGNCATLIYREKVVATASKDLEGVYVLNLEPSDTRIVNAAMTADNPAHLWHRRLGHLGATNLMKMVKTNMVTNLPLSIPQVRNFKDDICGTCLQGKQAKLPFAKSTRVTKAPLELVHMDVMGPFPVESIGGARYLATFLDDFSRLSVVRPVATKSAVPELVKIVMRLLETQCGNRAKTVRTDNGGEYVNLNLKKWFEECGVFHETTIPYTPEQNGKAERLNRTLLDKVRCMLQESKLPKNLWAEAVNTANYLRNRSPISSCDTMTPWELFYGNKPDVSNLRVFGADAYVHIPEHQRDKLSSRSIQGKMIGYASNSKGWRILLPDSSIKQSRNVVFEEAPLVDATSIATEEDDLAANQENVEPLAFSDDDNDNGDDDHHSSHGDSMETSDDDPDNPDNHKRSASRTTSQVLRGDTDDESMTRPPQRPRLQNVLFPRLPRFRGTPQQASINSAIVEPATAKEALTTPEASEWKAAMEDEIKSLKQNDTWELKPCPPDVRPIPVKWVFVVKKKANGSIERFKARLVVKGFHQQHGIDYDEVFAPTSKYATLRALLTYVATNDWECHQIDIKTAFLNGVLEETIYCQQPPCMEEEPRKYVCHLKKALYGLKQAPKAWYTKLKSEFAKMRFEPSLTDPGLFVNHTNPEAPQFCLVWVDDILCVGANLNVVNNIKAQLGKVFDLHDLGEVHFYLGITITRDRNAKVFKLHQAKQVKRLIEKFGMEKSKPRSVPISPGTLISKIDGDEFENKDNIYGQLVGSLIFLSICTRPDIAYSMSVLSKFMSAPTTAHWNIAKGVLRYLLDTSNKALVLGGHAKLVPTGYCDADYAGCVDTRKSTSGFVFFLGNSTINWSSKKQSTVAVSTTEAELVSATHAVKEALWITHLMRDMRLPVSTISIASDSQGAMHLINNPVQSQRSKHIDVVYHFAREHVVKGNVAFKYVPTSEMVADVFTKPLPKEKHWKCVDAMNVK